MDVNGITETNICQFVDQLKLPFTSGHGNKKAVCCCVFHLVLLYLDSLDVDEPIPSLIPRVSVWNSGLIAKVIKKDRKCHSPRVLVVNNCIGIHGIMLISLKCEIGMIKP